MQVIIKNISMHPFLRKFLEDILQQIQKINQKEKKNGIQEKGNLAQERGWEELSTPKEHLLQMGEDRGAGGRT